MVRQESTQESTWSTDLHLAISSSTLLSSTYYISIWHRARSSTISQTTIASKRRNTSWTHPSSWCRSATPYSTTILGPGYQRVVNRCIAIHAHHNHSLAAFLLPVKFEEYPFKLRNRTKMVNHPVLQLAEPIMAYTTSKTWLSEEAREYETWSRIRDNLGRVAPSSPFIPTNFQQWLDNRLQKNADEMQRTLAKIGDKINRRAHQPVQRILGGKELNDYLSLVLARDSIWRCSSEPAPWRRLAIWPTYEEFKHEGDDRFKSGYSRFPPLPRDPGNETVNWKQRKPLAQLPFDHIGQFAMGPDARTAKPFNGPEEQEALGYLGSSLIELLDP